MEQSMAGKNWRQRAKELFTKGSRRKPPEEDQRAFSKEYIAELQQMLDDYKASVESKRENHV